MNPFVLGLAAALVLCGAPAGAMPMRAPSISLIDDRVVAEVRQMAAATVVWRSVIAQNERNANVGQSDIDRLDAQWIAETESDNQPLIASTLTGPLSSYLIRVQAGALGLYTEIFVTDMHGLNVGQSAITSDYWQGDEAKFQKTYPIGPDAVFVDEAEYHEPSGTWRAQVNITVTEPENGQPIGAMTVEVNLTELQRRSRHAAGM